MLDALNPLMDRTPPPKAPNSPGTDIDYLRDQLFIGKKEIGFEAFMSVLNSQSFLPECIHPGCTSISEQQEINIVHALRRYLEGKVDAAIAKGLDNSICQFIDLVNWGKDVVITFNYDLLLEKFLEKKQIYPKHEIFHLHGSLLDGQTLVYPNYRKFTDEAQRKYFAERWKNAFKYLRGQIDTEPVSEWVFIGYSMPVTDAEAMGLFAYADYYNSSGQGYGYKIIVVNPDPGVMKNYTFFRKKEITDQPWKNIWKIYAHKEHACHWERYPYSFPGAPRQRRPLEPVARRGCLDNSHFLKDD
jgi:hypothetical protein